MSAAYQAAFERNLRANMEAAQRLHREQRVTPEAAMTLVGMTALETELQAIRAAMWKECPWDAEEKLSS